jgi:hypothetical protein
MKFECMDCGGPIMGWTTSRGKNRCGRCYLQWRRRLRFKEEIEILVGQVGWALILEMDSIEQPIKEYHS